MQFYFNDSTRFLKNKKKVHKVKEDDKGNENYGKGGIVGTITGTASDARDSASDKAEAAKDSAAAGANKAGETGSGVAEAGKDAAEAGKDGV